LEAGGGTAVILAGGIDVVYPTKNQKLYGEIADKGIIIAENPPGFPPTNRDFPGRNRIIADLSLSTIIVEAAVKSGSHHRAICIGTGARSDGCIRITHGPARRAPIA